MKKKLILSSTVLGLLSACGGSLVNPDVSVFVPESVVPTLMPTTTATPTVLPPPQPTVVPTPTLTPAPTVIPQPTTAPVPTVVPTPAPSATATPTPMPPPPTIAPTPTVVPTPTLVPTPTIQPSPAPSPKLEPTPTAAPSPTVAPLPTTVPSSPLEPMTISAIRPVYEVPEPSAEDRKLMQDLFKRLNRLRKEHSSGAYTDMTLNDDLSAFAMVRAKEISERNSHYRADGSRVSRSDESLVEADTIEEAFYTFQHNSGHYDNMMRPYGHDMGIGVYTNPTTGKRYWVMVFSNPAYPDSKLVSHYRFSNSGKQAATPAEIQNAANQANAYSVSDQGVRVNQTQVNLPNGDKLNLVKPEDYGWTHQTVGSIQESFNGFTAGYVNVGKPYVPAQDAQFQATYKGKAVGDWRNQAASSDVEAQVNFTGSEKNMELKVSNTVVAGQSKTELDFKDRLKWNSAAGQFEGGPNPYLWHSSNEEQGFGNHARFYGPRGEEIGGQFRYNYSDGPNSTYYGAYGAVKQ